MPYNGLGRLNLFVNKLFRYDTVFLRPLRLIFQIILHLELPAKFFKSGLKVAHPYNIIISPRTKMGRNVLVFNNVTIGNILAGVNRGTPEIGDNVIIYPYSVILGDITIGHDSIIGAGSIIRSSIPPYSIVAGNPAKVICENDPRFAVHIDHFNNYDL